jgi:hypothetical protein
VTTRRSAGIPPLLVNIANEIKTKIRSEADLSPTCSRIARELTRILRRVSDLNITHRQPPRSKETATATTRSSTQNHRLPVDINTSPWIDMLATAPGLSTETAQDNWIYLSQLRRSYGNARTVPASSAASLGIALGATVKSRQVSGRHKSFDDGGQYLCMDDEES